jgi:heme/copper-type cytochrome/quinol oxidase subunit 3
MAGATLPHDMPAAYEPSLFGTYSKKIGMWLFLLSDSLTFGALLYSYSYGRISTPNWPTPFHSESIVNATIMTAFLLTETRKHSGSGCWPPWHAGWASSSCTGGSGAS